MTMDVFQLDKFQDALNEVGNIGSGKASGALSALVKREVDLDPPQVYLAPVKSIPNLIGGQQNLVVGMYSTVSGDVSGTVLAVFPTKSALLLADLLSKKKPGTTKSIGAAEKKNLVEAGRLLSSSYTSTISEFLGLKTRLGDERIISTFGESLADFVLMGIHQEYALLLKTDFRIPKTEIQGDFVLLLAIDSLSSILEALRKKLE